MNVCDIIDVANHDQTYLHTLCAEQPLLLIVDQAAHQAQSVTEEL